MVRKPRKSSARRGPRGKRGSTGARGARGPIGLAGHDAAIVPQLGEILGRVTQDIEEIRETLQIQFTRIAELQAGLDSLRRVVDKSN